MSSSEAEAELLADTLTHKSVKVAGMLVNSMLEAPPAPTVTDAILVNVLGTFHPV